MCRIEFTNDYDFIILHLNKSLLQQIAEHDAVGEGRGAVWSLENSHRPERLHYICSIIIDKGIKDASQHQQVIAVLQV